MSYGHCDVCDRTLLWGGMSWVEHTEEYHALVRRRLLGGVRRALVKRLAVEAGHTVVIRFTQTGSWPQCSCGWVDDFPWPDSAYARSAGHGHLWDVGSGLLDTVPSD